MAVKMFESAFSVALHDAEWSLEVARKQSHDTVIANTGDTRRTGVEWFYFRPASKAPFELLRQGIVVGDDVVALCELVPNGVLVQACVGIEVDQ